VDRSKGSLPFKNLTETTLELIERLGASPHDSRLFADGLEFMDIDIEAASLHTSVGA
jgi:hypothetical protein